LVEPIPERIILPVHESTVKRALAVLHSKGDTALIRFLCEIIGALWEQNRAQAAYIEGMKAWFLDAKKQVRQEKLF
jgi:hypothetical protein